MQVSVESMQQELTLQYHKHRPMAGCAHNVKKHKVTLSSQYVIKFFARMSCKVKVLKATIDTITIAAK